MSSMADILVDRSFPMVPPEDEEDISLLKQRIITVDGYEVTLYHNKCRYNDNVVLKTVQIYSRTMTYLPFRLLCKIAKMFFGDEEPGFIDVSEPRLYGTTESRQIYIWTVYENEKGIIPFGKPSEFFEFSRCEFEGFSYYKMIRKK